MPSRDSLVPNRVTLALIVIVLLIFAFISGITFSFYASFLFLFYSWTNRMWISVIILGIFQTLILIPIRIINVRRSQDIDTIVKEVEDIEEEDAKYNTFREYFSAGNRPTLFYSVSFYIQLVSFASIGRLFLTDFYSVPIDPNKLWWFAPYPDYPIRDVFFRFPYPFPTEVQDFGLITFIILAGLILFAKYAIQKTLQEMQTKYGHKRISELDLNIVFKWIISTFGENSVILLVIAWIGTRMFPLSWEIRHFVGDITVPNRPLNTFTALVTFATIIWLNRNQIKEKYYALLEAGLSRIQAEQRRTIMWRETFFNATLIGLAAFFLTNQIPSAFELSVFTLELISLMSPFTLDRLIKLKPFKKKKKK